MKMKWEILKATMYLIWKQPMFYCPTVEAIHVQ